VDNSNAGVWLLPGKRWLCCDDRETILLVVKQRTFGRCTVDKVASRESKKQWLMLTQECGD
jgi:hypothetical protein